MQNSAGKLKYLSVLLSCCLMAAASVGICFYTSGIFYEPVAAGLGLSLGRTSMVTSIVLSFMALATLFLPAVLEKLPYHKMLIGGAFLAVGGTLLMAFSFHAATLYIAAALQGMGAAFFGLVPVTMIINNWFYSRNSWITSMALACSAVAGAVFTPLFSICLQNLGWRMTYVVEAVLLTVLLLPAVFLPFAVKPEALGLEPYGIQSVKAEGPASKKGRSLADFFALTGIAVLGAMLIGIPEHFGSYAASLGRPLLLGASMFSWAMIGNILFKLLGGFLSDKIGSAVSTGILTLLTLIASLGMLISIAGSNEVVLKVLAFLFGSAYAVAELSLPLLVKRQYGRARYSSIFAVVNALSLFVTALSIALVGWMFDKAGVYTWIWTGAVVIELLILVLVYCLMRFTNPVLAAALKEKTEQLKRKASRKEKEKAKDPEPMVMFSAEEIARDDTEEELTEGTVEPDGEAELTEVTVEPVESEETSAADLTAEPSFARTKEPADPEPSTEEASSLVQPMDVVEEALEEEAIRMMETNEPKQPEPDASADSAADPQKE